MHTNKLTLHSFRNYADAEIEFSPATNIIYGNNAQGKTNILEAVYLFSQGRSYRVKTDKEMILFGEQYARLSLIFEDERRSHAAEIRLLGDGRKKIKMNETPVTKLSMLMNYLNAVMFSPEDLMLIKGAPSGRRRFIDSAISQLYPKYLGALSRYHKALMQKNSLLRSLRASGKAADGALSVWNDSLAEHGAYIMKKRQSFLDEISSESSRIYSDIGKEKLEIYYTPSINCDIIESDGLQNALYEAFENHRGREIENGSSLMGIQRDDIRILIDGRDARIYASQGQQRSAVLALKIAQTEYICAHKGEYPILLLDDVMSELDASRRSYLEERIAGKQTIITCTDTSAVSDASDTKLFYVKKGTVTEV